MRTKVVEWGNSLGLRIPKLIADEIQVAEGTKVDLSMEDGCLIVRVPAEAEYSLNELLAGITDSNIHTEVGSGNPVGRERW